MTLRKPSNLIVLHLYARQRRNDSQASYYRLRGDCYLRLKNTDTYNNVVDIAISDLKQAAQMDRNNRENVVHLINVLVDCGRFESAIDGKNVIFSHFLTSLLLVFH